MALRKLITIHTPLRLTPEMIEVLSAISEQFNKPVLTPRSTGLVVYVNSWSKLAA